MRRLVFATASVCAVLATSMTAPAPAAADILLNVSKASQRIAVLVDGTERYIWPISSGRARYTTPNGIYQPEWLARKWHSREYHNAPMPYSIFFHGGYAIHGTDEVSRLGQAASHGCVRLDPKNAAILFDLVRHRMANTRIVVSNDAIGEPKTPAKFSPNVVENGKGVSAVRTAEADLGQTPVIVGASKPVNRSQPVKALAVAEPALPASPAQVDATSATQVDATSAMQVEAMDAAQAMAEAPAEPAVVRPAAHVASVQPGRMTSLRTVTHTAHGRTAAHVAHAAPVRTAARRRASAERGFHW
jgi:L,D-transpeptidase catalytic domain